MAAPMESFETQVLVALAEIKGDVALIKTQGDGYSKRLDEHWEEIKALKSSNAKTVGATLALAVVIPIIVSILALLIGG